MRDDGWYDEAQGRPCCYPDPPVARPPPTSSCGAIHWLVDAWRHRAVGNGAPPTVVRAFADVCGSEAGDVYATFDAFLRALAWAGRRRLRIGYPGAPQTTVDERRALALVAAAQAGHAAYFDAHLQWLARRDAAFVLTVTARALAAALTSHGSLLPLPSPSVRPWSRPRSLALLSTAQEVLAQTKDDQRANSSFDLKL
jgi:hypothetical protein